MIRHAEEADFFEISKMREPYVLDVGRLDDYKYRLQMQKSGFIGQMAKVDFQSDLHHLFLVSEDESGLLGYLRIDRDHEYQDNKEKMWLASDGKESYFAGHHAEVGMIGVREDMKGKGVAKSLIEEVCKLLQGKEIAFLFSIVVISPLTNFPSLLLHEKNNFQRVAVSKPHTHFDIINYQSLLYRRQL